MSDRPFKIKKDLFVYVEMILKGRCRIKIEIRISQLAKVTLVALFAVLTVIFLMTSECVTADSSDKEQLIAPMLFMFLDMLI